MFKSVNPDYFISHVDINRIKEYREEAAVLAGEPSIALLFRRISTSRLVTIAQIEGRARGAGSEFVLACDMRFAARETAILSQMEPAFGLVPGAGGVQHLTRLMGRGRALEVLLSADDYNADVAERYGWINRPHCPQARNRRVRQCAGTAYRQLPGDGSYVTVKDCVNTIALAPVDGFRLDSDLFAEHIRRPEAQSTAAGRDWTRGFQTRDAEMALGRLLGDLADR